LGRKVRIIRVFLLSFPLSFILFSLFLSQPLDLDLFFLFPTTAQSRLASSSALVVGLGGLGCPAALYLAAAGVGKLGLCDRDSVDVSNLHRQVLHETASAASSSAVEKTPKVESAAVALRRLNPGTRLELHGNGLTPENAEEMVEGFDVVLDCSDNAPTRYLLSDACCRRSRRRGGGRGRRSRRGSAAAIPLVSGAAIGGDGQLTVYCAAAVRERGRGERGGEEGEADGEGDGSAAADDTPCYRCLFPVPPPAASCGSCAEAGVLGPVPGVVGVLQALEAIKLLALGSREEQRKKGEEEEEERGSVAAAAPSSSAPPPPAMTPLCRRMLAFDGRDARFRTVQLRPRSGGCASCGDDGEGEQLDIAR
jgi:adenylyltransferase/sulfurtransferase